MDFIETTNENIIKHFLEYDANIESNVFIKVKGIKDRAEYGYIKITNEETHSFIKPILNWLCTLSLKLIFNK